ncbi:MAG: TRAP transporter large permease [Clostridia bacterium]|nr:TRAP transporter large permease [Clostridia bacterium]MDH7573977.1 TRAP transporter large permease [Clostridia bacterium]
MEPHSISLGIWGFVLLFALLAIGVPVAFALALVAFVGLLLTNGLQGALMALGYQAVSTISSYTWSVIPAFLLMGSAAAASGVAEDGYRAFQRWLGHLRGGLAMASIATCAVFAACTGSSSASVGFLGSTCLPEMERYKYKPRLATGSIAAGATLGILIPPSIPFVVYGIIAQESIGKLYIAGILPGLLLTGLFMATIAIWCGLDREAGPPGPRVSWRERWQSLGSLWGMIVIIVVVLGGIWGGLVTPTEAGSIGAIASIVLGLARRTLTAKKCLEVLRQTVIISGMMGALLACAMLFNVFLAQTGLPMALAAETVRLAISPRILLLFIFVFYLIGGCLMDSVALTTISLPIFVPIIQAVGIDPIVFGVFVVIMIETALITPPIGMNVYILSGMVRRIPMETIFQGALPFLMAMVLCLVLVLTIPELSLLLPATMR